MSDSFDVVIIGSGFGGAVMACRLAEAGRKVLVLERGREWKPEHYPRGPGDAWIWDDDHPEKDNGWIDLRLFPDMAVAQGAAVGGGSLIYANISVEAQPWVFEKDWPVGYSYEMLKPYYEEVGQMLNVHELPDNQLTERFKLMRDGAKAIGHENRLRKLPLAVTFSDAWNYDLEDPHDSRHSETWTNPQGKTQGTCIHCGNCDIGCPVGAKNTLDLNYLAAARNAGAEIRPLHIVRSIRPDAEGYDIGYDRIEDSRLLPGSVSARKVVLAAGSLGSTELLLRCRDQYKTLPSVSKRLGYGWSSNGDFLTPAIYSKRRISPTRGPTISAAIDFLDGSLDGNRIFVEDGGFPDVLGNSIRTLALKSNRIGGVFSAILNRLAEETKDDDRLEHIMPWFGQAVDAANGRLHMGRPWWKFFGRKELRLDWDIGDSEQVMETMVNMHKQLAKSTGGVPVEPLYWRIARDLVTPHPLGGCALADSPEHGVVDGSGQVFGYPGLYVADGSIFPKAVGLNPSRTIAALAEHLAKGMLNS